MFTSHRRGWRRGRVVLRAKALLAPAACLLATTAVGIATVGIASAATSAAQGAAGDTRAVTYHGLRLVVPTTWDVHDLAAEPRTCVRFDRPAIYLGSPGKDQQCPARAVGRAEGLLVQPATPDMTADQVDLASLSTAAQSGWLADTSQEMTYAVEGTGLALTIAYGDQLGAVGAALAGAQYSGPQRETPFAADATPSAALVDTPTLPAGGNSPRYIGRGFDTCAAPSTATMNAWLKSPFRTIGIYIGGVNRACSDGNLSASWVLANAKAGWRMLPIYVGRQAPCANQDDLGPIHPTNIAQQGTDAAADAIARAQHFGLFGGSTIYFDLESYDTRDASCRAVVLKFLSAWTTRLHDGGYLSGIYSSATSGILDLERAYSSPTFVRPEAIWIGRWNNQPSVFGEPTVPDSHWGTHQRIHQYRGPHNETWGGRTINIDSNGIDAPLSATKYLHKVVSKTNLVARTGPASTYPAVRSLVPGAGLQVVCQAWSSRVGTTRIWDKLLDGTYVTDLSVSTPSKTGFSPPVPKCRYPYSVLPDSLAVHAGPGQSYPKVGTIREGGLGYVACQRSGETSGGSSVWDKLDTGSWIPDGFVATPSRPDFSRPIPRC